MWWGEAAEDSAHDGAPEWWWFTCGSGAVLEVLLDGGGGMVVTVPLYGGGDGGHTIDPVSGESGLASLAPILGARVPVGRSRGLIRICVVCLYNGLGGVDSGTEMTLTASSSLSTMATMTRSSSPSSVTQSSPSPSPGDVNTCCLCATGYGHKPMPWMAQGGSWQPHGESAGSEGSIGQ
jgi:hypothetical protein